MKFYSLSAIILGFVFLFSGVAVKAQTLEPISFTTDFDFYIADKKMEAGEYMVSSLKPSFDGSIYLLRSKNNKSQTLFKVVPNHSTNYKGKNRFLFKFNRYGNDYFLSSISNDLTAYKATLSRTKKELEIAKNYAANNRQEVAAAAKK